MRLGKTSAYGLFAVLYVALNDHGKPIQGKEIAKAYNIPVEYLLKILQLLARNGILRSARGRAGGFCLQRQPQEITLKDIIMALESPRDCSQLLDSSVSGHRDVKEFLTVVFSGLQTAASEALGRISLQQLINLETTAEQVPVQA